MTRNTRFIVEIFDGADGQYWWRLKARNGRLLCGGVEGFTRRASALRSFRLLHFDDVEVRHIHGVHQ